MYPGWGYALLVHKAFCISSSLKNHPRRESLDYRCSLISVDYYAFGGNHGFLPVAGAPFQFLIKIVEDETFA